MIRRTFRKLLRRRRLHENLETELAFHEDMARAHENSIRLGTPARIKEQALDLWRFNFVENLWRDLHYAARTFSRSPVLLLCALLSLGFGTGANTAIFQLLDAVRIRPLPVPHPEQLAAVRIRLGNGGMGVNPGEYPELTRSIWQGIQQRQQAFSGIFAWSADQVNVGEGSALHRIKAMWVSGNFFAVLGINPFRGKLLSPEDEGPCPESSAVVSYAYWRSYMAGTVIDGSSTLLIDGLRRRIEGVLPPDFNGLSIGDRFDVILPLCRPEKVRRDVFDIAVMGRLRPGWTVQSASAQLSSISPALFASTVPPDSSAQNTEAYKRFRLSAFRASSGVSLLREQYDSSLWLLLAITGLVLLIACANLANLLLARASARDREMAVRLAIGASRTRLLTQLLAEGILLAGTGALLGIGLAQILSKLLVTTLSTEGNTVVLPLATDWRVGAFAAAVAGMICLVFTALPAARSLTTEPIAAMKASGRSSTAAHEHFYLQRSLVVLQIAVSLVLLVGAILLVRSFRNLITFNPGMREAQIAVAYLAFDRSHIAPDHYRQFQQQLLDEVRSIPGVLNAASTTNVPLVGGSWEHSIDIGSAKGLSKFTAVSPGYLDTMGIRLLEGRNISSSDTGGSQHVAIVNQTFVRRYLRSLNPTGQTIRTEPEPGYPSTVYQIIGVIQDTKYNDLRSETPPMTFVPASQYPSPGPFLALLIHSNVAPTEMASTLKRSMAREHPEVVVAVGDFQRWIRDSLVQERVMALLSGIFGFIAILLAVVGLYGVVSYLVASRRSEIGIRMALGAGRRQVIHLVLSDTWRVLLLGAAIGSVFSLIAGHALSSLLFGLKPYDPLTLASAVMLLALVSLLASFIPARKAAKLDPMIALRYE